jgi:hypothetical protein
MQKMKESYSRDVLPREDYGNVNENLQRSSIVMFGSGKAFGQSFQKSILIILFLFLTVSLIITWNTPSEGFESSIYNNTPLVLWIAIIFSVIVGISLVILSLSNSNLSSSNLWKYGLLLIFLCYAICLGLFIIRGFYSWNISGDTSTHLGWINEILMDGHIPETLFYPITHIFLSAITLVTTLNPLFLAKILPFFYGLLVIFCIYIFVRVISSHQIVPIIAVIIACTFPYGYFYGTFMPNFLGNLIIPLALFIMYKYLESNNISWSILFCITLILYPLFHFVPTLFLGICLVIPWILYMLLDFLNVFHEKNSGIQKLYKIPEKIVVPFLILLIWTHFWYSFYDPFRLTVLDLYRKIFIEEKGPSYLLDLSNQLSDAQTYGYNPVEVILRQYGNPIILLILSVLAFILLWKTIAGKQDQIKIFLLYGPWVILGILLMAFYLFHLYFGPLRIVTYITFLGTVFTAYLMSYMLFRSRNSKKIFIAWTIKIAVIVVLVCLFLSGLLTLYNSPYNKTLNNEQTTYSEISGMSFLFNYRQVIIPISGLTAAPGRFADLLLTPEGKAAQDIPDWYLDDKNKVPWHFGYDKFSSIAYSYNETTNLVITQKDKAIYTDYVPNMAKYRFFSYDFERLKNDSGASHIYSNGGFDLLEIVPEKVAPTDGIPL